MTPAFQAALADLATNERRALLCLGELDDVTPVLRSSDSRRSIFGALPKEARQRILVLASLVSERRFKRVSALLPASKRILGDDFTIGWHSYLDLASAGVPSATAEAVRFARFLQNGQPGGSLVEEVLRYEECLNEVSRRLTLNSLGARTVEFGRALALTDCLQLSPFALVKSFSRNIVSEVKQLRGGGSISRGEEGCAQSVIFKPKAESALAVDVSIIPSGLAYVLIRAIGPTSVESLLRLMAPESAYRSMAKLSYLLRADVIRHSEPEIS